MSLLIRALEQAAKDRTTTRVEPSPAPAAKPAVEPLREPTLEPPPPPRVAKPLDDPATRMQKAPGDAPAPGMPKPLDESPLRSTSPRPSLTPSALPASPAADKPKATRRPPSTPPASSAPAQQRARAATVIEAGGGAARNAVAYLRANPVMLLAATAVLFGLGFGVYVYLQIANPGLFVRKPNAPVQPVPAQAPSAGVAVPANTATQPVDPAAQPASPIAGDAVSNPNIPGSSVTATAVAPVAASSPVRERATGAPSAVQEKAAAAEAIAVPENPGLIATASVVASSGRVYAPAAEAPAEPRSERAQPRPSATPKAAAPSPRAAAAAEPAPRDHVAVSPTTAVARVNPQVSQAYTQLQAGSFDEARALYQRALQAEPLNLDALLGLAYIAAQENRADEALKTYLRILQINPRHSIAQAALIGLMGRADPISSETRLKQLLSREPSAFLHFVLGNLYADQSLWNQAQQSYFQAHHLEPDNPDYAYNLAVGLDHLRQSKLALDFYRRAERLANQQGRSNFNLSHARERIGSLTSQLE